MALAPTQYHQNLTSKSVDLKLRWSSYASSHYRHYRAFYPHYRNSIPIQPCCSISSYRSPWNHSRSKRSLHKQLALLFHLLPTNAHLQCQLRRILVDIRLRPRRTNTRWMGLALPRTMKLSIIVRTHSKLLRWWLRRLVGCRDRVPL